MKELFRGAPCQKPKLVLLTIKKQQGPGDKWECSSGPLLCLRWNYSCGPSELLPSWRRKAETMITVSLQDWLGGIIAKDEQDKFVRSRTDSQHVDPLLCCDGLAQNTVHCLFPGYILTNERLLLGFGGQSTYGESIPRVKTNCTARSEMCKCHWE